MGFADGMRMGMAAWDSAQEDKRRKAIEDRAEQQRLELEKVATAQPEQSQGFTAEQGDQLRAAAESGRYDIGFDDTRKAYTVTPKGDPRQSGSLGMQLVTDFNGQRTAGAMSDSQVANSRARGMAGVVMKTDPVQGMRMMRDVTQGERDDKRFGWEETRNERDLRAASKDEEYQSGKQDTFNNSVFGQKNAAFAKQYQAYVQSKQQYDEAIAAGKAPQEIGFAPQAPSRPAYTVADSLADQGSLLAHDAKYGKVDAKSFGDFTERLRKVEEEGYLKALNLAQGGGSIEQVAKAFNATGSMKLDPKAIVSDTMVKGQGGVPERVIQFKDEQGNTQTINVMSELKSLGKANDALSAFYQGENNRRGDVQLGISGAQLGLAQKADKRAQTIFDVEAPVHEAKAGIAKLQIALAETTDPKEQALLSEKISTLASGKRGITAQHDPADLMKANALVKNGIYPTQGEALDALVSKPDKLYQTYKDSAMKVTMNAEGAIESAKKMMVDDGWVKTSGGTWKRGGSPAEFASVADVEAAVKAGKVKSGDKVVVGGRSATWN